MELNVAEKIMESEKNRCLDEFIDYSNVTEAYKIAIESIQRRIAKPLIHVYMGEGVLLFLCPECKALAMNGQRFCNTCGQKLNWNEVGRF